LYRRTILRLSVIASFGCVVLANNAMSQQQSLKEQLVGAWAYVSSTAKLPDGSPLWGANPKGLITFSENGSFSWQIFRSDRPKFAVEETACRGRRRKNAATLQGSLAYFGTYSVNEAEKIITTVVEGSTYPNSEGETLKRVVTRITADTLVYEKSGDDTGRRGSRRRGRNSIKPLRLEFEMLVRACLTSSGLRCQLDRPASTMTWLEGVNENFGLRCPGGQVGRDAAAPHGLADINSCVRANVRFAIF